MQNFSQIGLLVPEIWHFEALGYFKSKNPICEKSRNSKCHISGTSGLIWLKFCMRGYFQIVPPPYEAILPSISARFEVTGGVSHLEEKIQKKGEYNEFLHFKPKCVIKLV